MSPLRIIAIVVMGCLVAAAQGQEAPRGLTAMLRELDTTVVSGEEARRRQLDQMLSRDLRSRIHAAHLRQAEEWKKVRTLADWERFRDARIAGLRAVVGEATPGKRKVSSVGTIEGEGYRIEKLIFAGRPGLPVTANLYLPARPPKSMPALIVCHSFFHPKHQGELQDLGVNGARCGCAVLVLDLLGHGERRQHPFVDAASYPEKFNVPRQDYYQRATLGLQLDVVGESLMGWMADDVSYAVDVLLARPDVDKEKIIVLGAVAAGGDVAAVAAALDRRIACVVPYNFGGPEPETPYPLPPETELSFPYAAGGHWDSTRRLRNSARDGFLPWVVVGAVAPRKVIYAHEFAWDEERDPAWKRLKKIYDLHDSSASLVAAFGKGTLFGKPEGTGCGNIGAFHRGTLAPHLRRWFGIAWPEKEITSRKTDAELLCLTPRLREEFQPRPVHELAADLAKSQMATARFQRSQVKAAVGRRWLRDGWGKLLGDIEVKSDPKILNRETKDFASGVVEKINLEVEGGIIVPMVLLVSAKRKAKAPVVVVLSQQGKGAVLKERAAEIQRLLEGGVAVCLPDVRGTGETRPAGDLRGRPAGFLAEVGKKSGGVLLANESLMLGQTLLGPRLRDVRSVLRYLRSRKDLDAGRVALWGDSFATVNGPDVKMEVPFDAAGPVTQAEPLGGLLALLTALFEDDVRAVTINRGMVGYFGVLRSAFVHVPADAIVPGALSVSDLVDLAGAIAPRPTRLTAPVDGQNRAVSQETLEREWKPALEGGNRLTLEAATPAEGATARWLIEALGRHR